MNQRLKNNVLAFRPELPTELHDKIARIKLLLVDVDGVLTDGTISFGDDLLEAKGFSTKDGLILGRIRKFGLLTGAISGRSSTATEARLSALRFDEIRLGFLAKWPVAHEIIGKHGLKPEQMAFIGDDLVDWPVMARCGLSVAPCDAHPAIINGVDLVLNSCGGQGCVREFLDLWLWSTGQWEAFVNSFDEGGDE